MGLGLGHVVLEVGGALPLEPRPRTSASPAVIHEGQLTYKQSGLERIVDLGEWWLLETGLPLPLGISLYSPVQHSGVTLQNVPARRRATASPKSHSRTSQFRFTRMFAWR